MRNGPDTAKLYKAAELRLYDYLLPSQTATGDGFPMTGLDFFSAIPRVERNWMGAEYEQDSRTGKRS